MKSLKKEENYTSLKKVKVSVLALTLIHTSLPLSAHAFLKRDNETWSQYTSGSGAKTIMGALNLVGNMSSQMYQQGQLSEQEIQGLQSFNESKKDAQTKLQSRRFHPAFNCPLAPEAILAPNGACSVGGQMKIPQQALEFGQNVLNEYMSFKKSRNVAPYVGSQCLEQGLKSIQDNYMTMTSKYEEMMTQFEGQLNQAIEVQKKNKIKVDELNALLNGGGKGVSQDFTNTDFNKLFPENCVDAYDVNSIIKKKGGGLVALKDQMTSDEREAKKFRGNSLATLNAKIASDKAQLIAAFDKDGLAALTRQSTYNGLQFGKVFNNAAKNIAVSDLNSRIVKVKNLMEKLGVSDADLPNDVTDPSYITKIERLSSKSASSYQEKFILECMTGSNSAAYSTPISQSINKFDHVKLGNSGDALDKFKRVASSAVSSPSSISSLDRTIGSLEDGNIRITVTNSSGQDVTKSVGQYYNDLKNECTAIYNGDLKPAGDAASLETYRSEVEELITEAKKLQQDTSRSIASGGEGSISALIDEALYNCGGRTIELSNCSESSVYNTSSDSFCVTQAASCSSNVAQCSAYTETLVNQKTTELKKQADLYNAQMMVQEQNAKALVNQMQSHMTTVADSMYKSMFPNLTPQMAKAYGLSSSHGLTFTDLMAIDVPKSDSQIAGIFLEKDPEEFKAALMAQMQKNVQEMKKNLDEWYTNQTTALSGQVDDINESMDIEITKWQNFVSDCNSAIQDTNSQIAKAQQEAAKTAAENSDEQYKFCQKLKGLQEQGPGPGCSGDHSASELYGDAVEIASVLEAQQQQRTPASLLTGSSSSTLIFEQINEYNRFCDEAVSEGRLTDGDDSESALDQMITLCEDKGGDEALIADLTDKLVEGLSEKEKKHENNLKKYLRGEEELNEELKKVILRDTRSLARQIRSLNETSKEFKDEDNYNLGFCSMLTTTSGRDTYVESQCKKYEDDTAKQRCEEKKEKLFKEDKLDALGLKGEAKVIAALNSPGIQNEWNAIGEKYSGTACAAINGSQFGSKGGIIPGIIEKINRDLASEDGMIQ